jgi:hypothetical protein
MMLTSIAEDLQARTLRAVSGLLGKLDYLASLRVEDGSYSHWGLTRTHGEAATQRALIDAHRGAVSAILRTPLQVLVKDVDDSSAPKKVEGREFLEDLSSRQDQLLPPGAGAGSSRHLNSVLRALLGLVETRR